METLAYCSIAMAALLFYRFSFVRFIAPLWIILYMFITGQSVTNYGLFTIIVCALVLMFFVLDDVRVYLKEAKDDAVVSSLDSEDEHDDSKTSSNVPKPKRTKVTLYTGTLVSHGFAPYNDVAGNDRSYFVDCDGKKVWGTGLKDAIKKSGAVNGDTVRFWKETEVRTKTAIIYDEKGKPSGSRKLSSDKRRGVWIMQVVPE